MILTCDLLNAVSVHVQQHAAVDDAAAQLKQAVERQSGNVGFAPSLTAVLHIFFKLQPPAQQPHKCLSICRSSPQLQIVIAPYLERYLFSYTSLVILQTGIIEFIKYSQGQSDLISRFCVQNITKNIPVALGKNNYDLREIMWLRG